MKPERLSALLLKYKDVPTKDFIVSIIASKVDSIELLLMEKLYPDPAQRDTAYERVEADSLVLLENYLNLLRAGQAGDGECGQSSSNN